MGKINILGIQVDSLTQNQVLERVELFLNSQKQHHLITVNPEMVLSAVKNENYLNIINNASLTTADGIGLLWAAKFLTLKSSNLVHSLIQMLVSGISLVLYPKYCQEILPERIAGVDLMEKICELASQNNWKIYLLGGKEGIAVKTAQAMQKKYAHLNIVGAEAGPYFEFRISNFEFRNNDQNLNTEFLNIISNINDRKPDILFVAFGAPKQEFWINEFLPKMPSVKLAMGVGGAFNFISGKAKRAPKIYQNLGLEWLFRLVHQPWRAIRIFNATIKFVYNVVKFKQRANDLPSSRCGGTSARQARTRTNRPHLPAGRQEPLTLLKSKYNESKNIA